MLATVQAKRGTCGLVSLMRGNRGEGVREIDSVISGGISAVPTRGALAARRKHVRVANTNQGTARPTDREKSLEKWGCGSSCLSSRILNARCPKREALLQATISVGCFLPRASPNPSAIGRVPRASHVGWVFSGSSWPPHREAAFRCGCTEKYPVVCPGLRPSWPAPVAARLTQEEASTWGT